MINSEKAPINKGFKSRTNITLIATSAILSAIWGVGADLGISEENLSYMEKAVSILGMVIAVLFRNNTTKKIEAWEKEQNF